VDPSWSCCTQADQKKKLLSMKKVLTAIAKHFPEPPAEALARVPLDALLDEGGPLDDEADLVARPLPAVLDPYEHNPDDPRNHVPHRCASTSGAFYVPRSFENAQTNQGARLCSRMLCISAGTQKDPVSPGALDSFWSAPIKRASRPTCISRVHRFQESQASQ
jgi:hypothetical protein